MTAEPSRGRIRRDLDAMIEGALEAVDPEPLVRRALSPPPSPDSSSPRAAGSPGSSSGAVGAAPGAAPEQAVPPELTEGGNVVLVAVGKASPAMARGASAVLGSRIRAGVVLLPRTREEEGDEAGGAESLSGLPEGVDAFRGGHPLPDGETVRGAEAVLDLVTRASADEHIVFLLSGGASSLLTIPAPGLTVNDVAETTRLLMEAGADIVELNTVRKHLDRLKGGGLARAASPTPVWAGILSDVVGDRLDIIGSGPVSPDSSTFPDALRVIRRRIPDTVPPRVLRHLKRGARGELPETPGEGAPCFRGVRAVVIGNAATAVSGAARVARKRGYVVRAGSFSVTGEARTVGRELGIVARRLAEEALRTERPVCHLSAGETTVTVRGSGRGGPNQEVALAAALELGREEGEGGSGGAAAHPPPVELLIASFGTDGIDGPTPAAGAVADAGTVARARTGGISPEDALEENDSHTFFRATDGLLTPGPTGTNVMDLHLILARPHSGPPES